MTNEHRAPSSTDREAHSSRFERWTQTNITGVSSSRLVPRWWLLGMAASIVLIAVGVGVLRSGTGAALSFGLGTVVLVPLFLREWFVITAKGYQYLRSKPDLPDDLRLLMLAGLFLVIPILGGLVGFVGLVLLRMWRGW